MKILVVDDNAENLKDALSVLTALGHQVMLACSPEHLGYFLETNNGHGIEAVISDVFMPRGTSSPGVSTRWFDYSILKEYPLTEEDSTIKALDVYSQIEYVIAKHVFDGQEAEWPTGILAAQMAQNKGLPVVLCSSEKRHGAKVKWIESLGYHGGPLLINNHEETKNWTRAVECLSDEIERRKK